MHGHLRSSQGNGHTARSAGKRALAEAVELQSQRRKLDVTELSYMGVRSTNVLQGSLDSCARVVERKRVLSCSGVELGAGGAAEFVVLEPSVLQSPVGRSQPVKVARTCTDVRSNQLAIQPLMSLGL